MLQDRIRADMENAMRNKNAVALDTLRMLITAITNELKSVGKMLVERMEDEQVLTIIRREVKKRKEAEEIYKGAKRNDLAEKEIAERAILEAYLPPQMSAEEIMKVVLKKKEDLGVTSKKDTGILVGRVMKELAGKADGVAVKAAVDSVLQ